MVLTQLVNLRLNGMYGTDAQCEYLSDQSIEQLTLLTELECKKFILITDRSIKKLTKLAVLQCGGCEGITDRSIEWLIRLTKLSCRNCKEITDWSMTRLTRLDSLYCNFLDPAQNCTTVKCSNGRGNVNNNSHGSNTYLSSEGITRESLDKLPHLKCVNALSYCSLREVKPSHTSKFDLIIESVRAGAMRLFESLSY